jgi:F-type H+-transporting ATPase subunit b
MHIDWFVFFAQIVNFLILFTLLKKFLYGRIIGAIDAREAKISSIFSEAEKSREEAHEKSVFCEKWLQDLENASDSMMNKARADAEAYRKELMEKARVEIELIQNRWIETLRAERENFFYELRRLTGAQVYAVTRRVLKDLADIDLEERILQILAERIETLDRDEQEKIRSLMRVTKKVTILSAFDIRPDMRGKLDQIIDRKIGPGIAVAYVKSEDVMSGCEFRINGYKVAWSMKDYLETLEEKFCHLLYEESQGDKKDRPDGGVT